MPTKPENNRRRIQFTDDGPALIEGPVEVIRADGTRMTCDRFQVALCLCKRSKNYPLCDTSHRKRARPAN